MDGRETGQEVEASAEEQDGGPVTGEVAVAVGIGQNLTVTANIARTAQSSASWLTLSTASGSENGTITYAVAANTDTDPRTAIITVTGNNLTRTFTATQSGAEAQLAPEVPIDVLHQWLEANAADILAANGGDVEAAAAAEAANGRPIWECYVAGLSATNATANFQVKSLSFVDGEPVVEWTPELPAEEAAKRRYTTYGIVNLTNADWTPVNGDATNYNFFRVTVEMKESPRPQQGFCSGPPAGPASLPQAARRR